MKSLYKELPFRDSQEILIPYLKKIKHRINKLDFDSFIVVCGNERLGKSTLAAQVGDFISNDELKIENICMDMGEFLTALKDSKKGDVIIFDEAGVNLYSREAMTNINRSLTKAFMVSGLKNICIILCIPSFFSLDSYIRQHRLNLLLYVKARGKFKVYSKKRAREISTKGAKDKKVDIVRANTVGVFTKQFPEYVNKQYRAKEIKFKMGYIKNIKDHIEGNYTTTKFCEVTGFTLKSVMRWIAASKIKAKKIGGFWYIPKSEAQRIVDEKYKNVERRT